MQPLFQGQEVLCVFQSYCSSSLPNPRGNFCLIFTGKTGRAHQGKNHESVGVDLSLNPGASEFSTLSSSHLVLSCALITAPSVTGDRGFCSSSAGIVCLRFQRGDLSGDLSSLVGVKRITDFQLVQLFLIVVAVVTIFKIFICQSRNQKY